MDLIWLCSHIWNKYVQICASKKQPWEKRWLFLMISGVIRLPAGNRGMCIWVILSEFSKGIICKSLGRYIETKREQLLASGDRQGGPSTRAVSFRHVSYDSPIGWKLKNKYSDSFSSFLLLSCLGFLMSRRQLEARQVTLPGPRTEWRRAEVDLEGHREGIHHKWYHLVE